MSMRRFAVTAGVLALALGAGVALSAMALAETGALGERHGAERHAAAERERDDTGFDRKVTHRHA